MFDRSVNINLNLIRSISLQAYIVGIARLLFNIVDINYQEEVDRR